MSSPISKVVIGYIKEGKDESLLKQMEGGPDSNTIDDFKSFMEILVILIEKSKLRETAIKIFIDSIFRDNNFMIMQPLPRKKEALIEVLRDRAIFPYVNTSNMLRRIMLEMYSNPTGFDALRFANVFTTWELLDINQTYLDKYLTDRSMENFDGISLLYSCPSGNTDNKVILSTYACDRFRSKLFDDEKSRLFYLSYFFRPLYQTNNENFPDAKLHVAEPFYIQIFEHFFLFKDFLGFRSLSAKETVLKKEILEVVNSLNNPSDPFDISKFRITFSLHQGVRKITS